jgi:hypothetical protein
VDLFGEQTVQVVAATLQAALVLTVAMLLVLLSVRLVQRAGLAPAWASVSTCAHVTPPARADRPSVRELSTSLPVRAPPDPGSRPIMPPGRFHRLGHLSRAILPVHIG